VAWRREHNDPFPYFDFENHAHQTGAPAIVDDWTINKIEMETGPFIETEPKYFERNPEKREWSRRGP
jgi:hypothetical protein